MLNSKGGRRQWAGAPDATDRTVQCDHDPTIWSAGHRPIGYGITVLFGLLAVAQPLNERSITDYINRADAVLKDRHNPDPQWLPPSSDPLRPLLPIRRPAARHVRRGDRRPS